MQDWLCLYDDKAELLRVHCQSVANYNWGEYKSNGATECGDTIKEGYFKVKCFVEPRGFEGEIHGIIETKDIDGQWIDHESLQTVNGYQTGRWLIHSNYSKKIGKDTNYAWSAGCLICSSDDLYSINLVLHEYGIKSGDILNGEIVEVDIV